MIVPAATNAWNPNTGSPQARCSVLWKRPCGAGGRTAIAATSDCPARRSDIVQVISSSLYGGSIVSRQSAPLAPTNVEPDGKDIRPTSRVASADDTFDTV